MSTIDPATLEGLTEIFRVLGDPTRLRILEALSRGELCVGDLAGQLGVTESAVSHQLRLLRSARIVRARRDGRMVFYSLDDRHVLTLFEQGLRHVQEAGGAPVSPQPAAAGALVTPKPNPGSRPVSPKAGSAGAAVAQKASSAGAAVAQKASSGGGLVPPKPNGGGGR